MTQAPEIGEQHQPTLKDHASAVRMLAESLTGAIATFRLDPVQLVEVTEAALATVFQQRGIDPDGPINVTVLLSGEVATDLLPHLSPKAAA